MPVGSIILESLLFSLSSLFIHAIYHKNIDPEKSPPTRSLMHPQFPITKTCV